MASLTPLPVKVGPELLGEWIAPQQQDHQIRERESHQDPQQALGFVDLQVQAAQPQVAFPIAKTLLDLHRLSTKPDHFVRGEPTFEIRRHD